MKEPQTLDFALAQVSHLHYQRVHELLEAIGLYRGQPPGAACALGTGRPDPGELAERMHNTPRHHHQNAAAHGKSGLYHRGSRILPTSAFRAVYLTEAGRDDPGQVQMVWRNDGSRNIRGF